MVVSEATYEQVALEDPIGGWELVCGRLRSKPGMTVEHEGVKRRLSRRLGAQLNEDDYDVATDGPRLRVSAGSYFLPDVCVVPRALVDERHHSAPRRLEVYDQPMPLAVEIWSPSAGDYDVDQKLREYQQRGDLEIWRIHSYERTLTAWRRDPVGGYAETGYSAGSPIRPATLPGVEIDLERLFD